MINYKTLMKNEEMESILQRVSGWCELTWIISDSPSELAD
jgi:hypothetical protein